jgi:hypothetical protein
MEGCEYNDIVEEGRERGIPSIIIEYMELISNEIIHQINKTVIEWINS